MTMRVRAIVASILLALPLSAAAQSVKLRVVSNPKPELVSGGDVLVSVTGARPATVRLTLNGTDVTSALRPDGFALVTHLSDGPNALVATAGKATAKLTVVNHPIMGPVISGPHEQPFICETEKFMLMAGGTLGKPLDADCSAATRVDHVYKS